MTDFAPAATPFTGRKMLFAILAFFGVVIAANMTMLVFAVNSFGGLVVENSYVASQSFNEDVAAAQAQPMYRWSIAVAGRDALTASIAHENGNPVQRLSLTAIAARPSHERETLSIPLSEAAPGEYRGETGLAPGQWRITLNTDDGQARTFDLTVPVP